MGSLHDAVGQDKHASNQPANQAVKERYQIGFLFPFMAARSVGTWLVGFGFMEHREAFCHKLEPQFGIIKMTMTLLRRGTLPFICCGRQSNSREYGHPYSPSWMPELGGIGWAGGQSWAGRSMAALSWSSDWATSRRGNR